MKKLTLAHVIVGYQLAVQARHLSSHTLADYNNTFKKFTAFMADDPPFSKITSKQIEAFLAAQTTVSKKTVLNYHTGLAALWTWAVKEGLAEVNIVHQVIPAKPEKKAIVPFTLEDIKALLDILVYSRPYARPGKRETRHKLPFADRNRAIILLLLDTGIRASELCTIQINQVDFRNNRITVFGKGDKERTIPFSPRTGQALWRLLATRKNDRLDDYLITTSAGNQMDRLQLLKLLHSAGCRAGIENVHPHRFRHTFAINYLRNGGDPYTLQMILGHETMEMVRRYLKIAQADLDLSHRRASPVDNWRL